METSENILEGVLKEFVNRQKYRVNLGMKKR